MGEIYRGNNAISAIYRGNAAVSNVYRGNVEVWSAAPAGPLRPYLTSAELTDAYMLVSFNLLNSSYTGDCCEVRRSSDNTTQDIGFASDGTLDEAALLSFVGSGDGFLSKWYSQVNGYNVFNTNNSAQAKIVDTGTVVKVNNKVSPLFTDVAAGTGASTNNYRFSNNMSADGDMSFFHVVTKPFNSQTYAWQSTTGGGHPTFIFQYNPGSGVKDVEWYAGAERYTLSASGMSTTDLSLLSVTRTAATGNLVVYFDGTQTVTQASTQSYSGNTLKNLMCNNNKGTNAHCSEWIAYTAAKTSDASSINSNITTYYGI